MWEIRKMGGMKGVGGGRAGGQAGEARWVKEGCFGREWCLEIGLAVTEKESVCVTIRMRMRIECWTLSNYIR